jgi:hypothetical protein
MKWELYLSRRQWEELKAAVRERAPKDERGRPCCERCGRPNGRLRRTKQGYLVPHWLHTAHVHGAAMRSQDPDDYLLLCDACHMWYDRQPDGNGWTPPYRKGYIATTTDQLIQAMKEVGLELWQDGELWCWRFANTGGAADSPARAVASAVFRMHSVILGGVGRADPGRESEAGHE